MNKIFIACLASFLFLAGCEKKEEPKVQAPIPPSVANVQQEIAHLQHAIGKNPKDVNAWVKLGNMLMDTSRFNEAVYAYEKALELNENNVNVRVDLGTCYRRIGLPKKAVEEYRKAIAINPRHPNAHRNLGVVLASDLKQKADAIRALEEYLRLSPDAPDAARIKQSIAQLKANP